MKFVKLIKNLVTKNISFPIALFSKFLVEFKEMYFYDNQQILIETVP